MGIVVDTCILIATEKRRFRLQEFHAAYPKEEFFISTITASELLHGVERAVPSTRKAIRASDVERFIDDFELLDFDLFTARRHAALWAELETKGAIIGPYDLLIAASALAHECKLATLNMAEFKRVPGLQLIDITPFTS